MNDDLESLKSNPACLRIYGSYLKLKSIGGGKYQCLCPFHSEKSGSVTIHADLSFHCYGCSESGNIMQFVQKMENCTFQEAVEKVKKEVGPSTWEQTRQKVDSVFKPVVDKKDYRTIPMEGWKKAEDALAASKEARDWLLNVRGITYETAKTLRLGFLQDIGKLAGAEGSEVANKGWVGFPCIDGQNIISIKYRSIAAKRFSRQPGMATALFNTPCIDPFEPVYLTEGEFDAACLVQAGFKAVSLASASAKPTPEQKDLLMQASYIVLAGDTDEAGAGPMSRLWRELDRAFLLKWPNAKDANEYFLKQCKGDVSIFRTKVEELTSLAKAQPMPSMYSLTDVMRNGDEGQISERPDRLRFPWPSVDKMLVVLPGHVLGVGASNTGMGKTMWTVQATLHNARKYGQTILNFQAEMDPSEIGDLVAAQVLRVDRNFLTREDRVKAADILANEGVQYYIGRDPNITELKEVLDLLEAAIKRLSPDVAVLDHFHHFSAGADNETKAQAEAATRIKAIADKYKVKFINVGQPRKPNAQNKGRKIHISDFKGSGAWGDAANGVLIIHRELNKSEDMSHAKGPYEDKTLVQVLKGRSLGKGPSAAFLTCFGEFGSFEEIDTSHEEIPD